MLGSGILKCRWTGCFEDFTDVIALSQHVLDAHGTCEGSYCLWEFCNQYNFALLDRTSEASKSHLLSHSVFELYSWNSTKALIDRGLNYLPHPLTCNQKYTSGESSDQFIRKSSEFEADGLLTIALKPEADSPLPVVPTFFGCYGCHSVFKMESELLQHFLPTLYDLVPDTSGADTSGYRCHWVGCSDTFETPGRLQCHVENQHIQHNVSPFCLWRRCPSDSMKLTSLDRWRRHMLLHTFVETCIGLTKVRLDACRRQWTLECRGVPNLKPFYVNRSTDKLFWLENILAHDFQCRWADCNFSTSSAHLYTEHVVDHATAEVNTNGLCLCRWMISPEDISTGSTQQCGRTVRAFTVLKEHLYRHTGLPKFVCNKCYVGFTEFATYKEHFMWSLTDRDKPYLCGSAANFGSDSGVGDTVGSAIGGPSQAQMNQEHSRPRIQFERCLYCAKQFLTKHRLWAHQKALNCVPPQERATIRANLRLLEDRTCVTRFKRKSNCTHVPRNIHLPDVNTDKTSQLYFCQVEDCEFRSGLYAAYLRHFKRFHHPSNPGGVWYECHICRGFRVRKVQTISHHLRIVHRFRPQGERQRFSYSCNQNDGIYRLTGLPPAPNTGNLRKILPRTT
ncbi:unnamed protein product [Dicrocoelium dendriticum]|nr:unnamed protein product [Dicrocoelium dendriticum]